MNDNEMIEKLLEEIKKFAKKYGFACWLGFSLSMFGDIHLLDPSWWFIVVPVFALLAWRDWL